MYNVPEATDDGKSLVNKVNSVGPNTEPWGMPARTGRVSDAAQFNGYR